MNFKHFDKKYFNNLCELKTIIVGNFFLKNHNFISTLKKSRICHF